MIPLGKMADDYVMLYDNNDVIVSCAMPGDLALKSTAIDTFFYGMKPRYPAGRGYDLYQNETLVGRI